VFVYAPFDERVRRLQSTGKSEQEAIDLAETVDRDRATFIKQYFNVEWPARDRFHVMVNSAMGDDVAVTVILDALARYDAARDVHSTHGAAQATTR
jgi:cytidylate kinase